MTLSPSAENAARSFCPACGQVFACGAENHLAICWCMQQTALAQAPDAGSSCYCPGCLQRLTAREAPDAPANRE